ncbi:MAG TPA: hypothetical protein VLT33_02495, partial [Labilithrix sp.]|nr:hypothetical protein [Labilithrix sp.]
EAAGADTTTTAAETTLGRSPEAPCPPSAAELPAALVAPATRYAALLPEACGAELVARGIPHERLGATRGVAAPARLTGPISGVTFRTLLPEKIRVRSPYEIFDCRLLLALDDFAKLLAAAHVVEVVHYSAYRPPPAGWSDGPFGLRHDGGLAIDVAYFRSSDGSALNVERDFAPRPGERPCTPGPVPRDATSESLALRNIVCGGHQARLFHLLLTPDYDRTHRDHFHLEVTPGASSFVVR